MHLLFIAEAVCSMKRKCVTDKKCAEAQQVPFTNYGTAIAYMNGILKRSLEIFPDLQNEIL